MEDFFTIVSSKGQIVIPSALREKLRIRTGTRLAIRSENNQLVLQPITEQFIDSLLGCCKGEGSLVELREREHRVEKDRTAKK
ncbi:MAG: AbrB/MazE/SpoVT family DNA-binding protein [Acidobacteriaceae bacterium]|nr:AbrB/MazE/SpoVT family DNA-binding protein [Acidobacteriaceae bacterium]